MRLRLLALVTVVALSGCYTLRAQLPGALRADLADEDVQIVGAFRTEVHAPFLLWGLYGAPPEELVQEDLLRQVEAAGADGVANLLFESYFTPVDVLLNGVTLGVLSPRTYVVRGDLVKLRRGPLPGEPLLRRAAEAP